MHLIVVTLKISKKETKFSHFLGNLHRVSMATGNQPSLFNFPDATLTFATAAVRPPQKVNWKIPTSAVEFFYGLILSRSHLLRPPYGGF